MNLPSALDNPCGWSLCGARPQSDSPSIGDGEGSDYAVKLSQRGVLVVQPLPRQHPAADSAHLGINAPFSKGGV